MEVKGTIDDPKLMYLLTTLSKGEYAEYIYKAAVMCPVFWSNFSTVSRRPDLLTNDRRKGGYALVRAMYPPLGPISVRGLPHTKSCCI